MQLALLAKNRAAHPLDLYLRGRSPTFDVTITREDGTLVWQRLHDEIIPAIVRIRTMAPGEKLELAAEWNGLDQSGRAPAAGRYFASGVLLLEEEPLQAPPVDFIVER